ncbi:TPA: hypothetical protein ACGD7V_003713 [Serratia marcescens]|nr:hypothetical protein SMQC21_10390 [Serratia marcescens]HEP0388050.1 hypothetical protein [Serratia marcescens]
MSTTELIFAKKPGAEVIDDGCDHTALIIWRMNANARARTGSTFVLPPVPEQVVPPKYAKTATKADKRSVGKRKSSKVDFPTRNLAAVMMGKTLTYRGIMTALDTYYPEHGLTQRHLQTRILTMINSPHVEITRHEKPVPEFTLTHVDGQFYVNSENQQHLARG